MEKGNCVNLKHAATYIEECFENKCREYNVEDTILQYWKVDKEYFTSYISISGFDFQHYSLHDSSHSESILHNIEEILGRERVELLGVGDLWLLLESAYAHDVGMSIEYEELVAIWESKAFKDYIEECTIAESWDKAMASQFYKYLDKLIHNRKQIEKAKDEKDIYDIDISEFEDEFEKILSRESWPVLAERYIMMLYTDYIRRKHPTYSKERIVKYGEEKERGIPSRMYKILGDIALLHGLDFEDIFNKAEKEEESFKIDSKKMHPQFAAAMLRVGDLLDMDNNRFNIRMLKHMGILPLESVLHYKKHKAIEHLCYTEFGIEATAKSEEVGVCQVASQWFKMIEQEVTNLICHWNQIVPSELMGCRLNCCKLEIYYKGERFEADKQSKINVDPTRIFKLLIGENIYKTRMEFIREYLQNAMDASRMALWLYLKKYMISDINPKNKLTPFDISADIYEQYKIKINLKIEWEQQKLLFSIQDSGIGMEPECISALSNVSGDNWKRRKTYVTEIQKMPLWLRPTGGFGIGVQSAFMFSDNVTFYTKTEQDITGRVISLDSIRKGGKISEYNDAEVEKGTEVKIEIKLVDFLSEIFEVAKKEENIFENLISDYKNSYNIYDKDNLADFLQEVLVLYVSSMADNSFFPIIIQCENKKEKRIELNRRWFDKSNRWKTADFDKNGNENKIKYGFIYDGGELQHILWDEDRQVMAIYHLAKQGFEKNRFYYKNVWVSEEDIASNGTFTVDIVYFFDNVMRSLSVNRVHFLQQVRSAYRKSLSEYQYKYAMILAGNQISKIEVSTLKENLAKQLLIWKALNIVNYSKDKLTVFMDIVKSHCVETKYIDKTELIGYKNTFQELKGLRQGEDFEKEDVYEVVLRNFVLKKKYIPIDEFIEKIKKTKDYFYIEDVLVPRNGYIKAESFLEALYRQETKSTGGKQEEDWKKICPILLKDQSFIVVDNYIVPLLKAFVQNYEEENKLDRLCIENNGHVIMGLCHYYTREGRSRDKQSVEEFIKQLKNSSASPVFPIIIEQLREKEDEIKPIINKFWVSRVFPGAVTNSLYNAYQGDVEDKNKKYMIIPINQEMWYAILKLEEEEEEKREKYNNIVKKKEEWNLLVAWVYKYQLADPKLNEGEIRELISEIQDWIYELLFL